MEKDFEIKGTYEIEEDKVIFDIELKNLDSKCKQISFPSGQQFELVITNDKGEEVYRYSEDKMFTQAIAFKKVEPGEGLKWRDAWYKMDKNGYKLSTGKYKAIIQVMLMNENVSKMKQDLKTQLEFKL